MSITASAALLHLSVVISSIVPCSSGRSMAWLESSTPAVPSIAETSANLFLLPVMKLRCFDGILVDDL